MKQQVFSIAIGLLFASPASSDVNSGHHIAKLGDIAWKGFVCVRLFDEQGQGFVASGADSLFERSLISARAFLNAYSEGLISGSAMVDMVTFDERRFLFGPTTEFKLGAMYTYATLFADGLVGEANLGRTQRAASLASDLGCGDLL